MYKQSYYYPKNIELLNFFDPSGDTALLFDSVMDFSERTLEPLNKTLDEKNAFPEELYEAYGAQGYAAPTVSEKYGGSGGNYLHQVVIIEGSSYGAPGPALTMTANSTLFIDAVYQNANHEQREKFIREAAAGKKRGGVCLTEPDGGSAFINEMITTLTPDENNPKMYRLNGQKAWITNAGEADYLLCATRSGPPGSKKLTLVVVDTNTEGFEITKKEDKFGMRGSGTYRLSLDNCLIPEDNIIGAKHKGLDIITKNLNTERVVLTAGAIGVAQNSLDHIIDYCGMRFQKGKPIGANQAYAHFVAQMHSDLMASRRNLYTVTSMYDRTGVLPPEDAASVFLDASQKSVVITQHCMRLAGAMGYTKETRLGQNHADSQLYAFGGGAEEIRKDTIATTLLKGFKEYNKMISDRTTPEFTKELKQRLGLR